MKKKVIKKKTTKIPKKRAAPKVRNSNTLSESGFWSFIRSALRQKSRWWKPILETKNAQKIAYKGPNKRRKFSYICEECKNEFDAKKVAVHHKIPCGTLTCANDLSAFVENLFCEKDGLILLCELCHNKKHTK